MTSRIPQHYGLLNIGMYWLNVLYVKDSVLYIFALRALEQCLFANSWHTIVIWEFQIIFPVNHDSFIGQRINCMHIFISSNASLSG